MKKFFYGMLVMYFANRIGRWWAPVLVSVITKTPLNKTRPDLPRSSTTVPRPYPPNRFGATQATSSTDRPGDPSDIYKLKFSSYAVADGILDEMKELVHRYNRVYVADVMELIGKYPIIDDSRYGWTDIIDIKIQPVKYEKHVFLTGPKPIRL